MSTSSSHITSSKSNALLSKNKTSTDKSTDLSARFSNAGFSNNGGIFNLTQIPIRPRLTASPQIQCCAKDGGNCSCPKCKSARQHEVVAEDEQSSEPSQEPSPLAVENTAPDQTPVATENPEAVETASQIQAETSTAETPVQGLIADDSAAELSDGQLKKTEFLQQLREQICTAVGPILAAVGQTTEGCPYLNYWLGLYQTKEATEVERTVRRYAPDSVNARSALDYISIVTQRATRAAEIWARTGRVIDVPEGAGTSIPGRAAEPAEAESPVQAKPKSGGVKKSDDPRSIKNQLGEGQPLTSSVRSRMESAFEMNFSNVRTHTDSNASMLSDGVNARAFTVGNHVAFGSGEYQPGTLVGDALIAHELAHTIQQKDAEEGMAKLDVSDNNYEALEKDADETAVSAMSSLWGEKKSIKGISALRSGLRLQRCDGCGSSCSTRSGGSSSSTPASPAAPAAPAVATPTVVVGNFRNSGSTADSGENNCANCPRDLGVHTSDFHNGMELRGDITNHVPTAKYDFKRTKERGTWQLVNGTWSQMSYVAAGTNDDNTERDESLTPVNNHIYSEDIPGFGANPASDPAATEAVYKASFVEWVNVQVGSGTWSKQSNEFDWHSITWLEKAGGNWQRKAGGTNEIATGSTTIGTGNP